MHCMSQVHEAKYFKLKRLNNITDVTFLKFYFFFIFFVTLRAAVDVPRPLVHRSITPYEQNVSRTEIYLNLLIKTWASTNYKETSVYLYS